MKSRPEVIGMLNELKADPDNPDMYHILADWLEERGDIKGTLLRTEARLLEVPDGEKPPQGLVEENRKLRGELKSWYAALGHKNVNVYQGLLMLSTGAEPLLKEWSPLFDTEMWAWVSRLSLYDLTDKPALLLELVKHRAFERLIYLDITDQWCPEEIKVLLRSDQLNYLRWLFLCPFNENAEFPASKFLTLLAEYSQFSQLRHLFLNFCGIDDDEIELLKQSKTSFRLRTLDLRWNAITNRGATALAQWERAKSFRELNLSGNQLSDAGAISLADSPYLSELEYLDVSGNTLIGPQGIQILKNHFGERVVTNDLFLA